MVDQPVTQQVKSFTKAILRNPNIRAILSRDPFPRLANWYLGAGCLCQTVWNSLLNKEVAQGIDDYDLVYYDAKDITKKSETVQQKRIRNLFKDLPVKIEVVNEARVHLWFEKDFGKKISQFKSAEDAINQWPTTATAIGVNRTNGKINVYAPYGLNDLFGLVIRPNKPFVLRHVYERKVKKWITKWPSLKVLSWDQV